MKLQQLHSPILRALVAATVFSALASGLAAEPGARPDVTVTVFQTHYVLAGRAFDTPEKLVAAVDAMSPRSVGIDACGPGTRRSLMAAVYQLRARPLHLQTRESEEAACAKQGAAALMVSLPTMQIIDEVEVRRYWQNIAP